MAAKLISYKILMILFSNIIYVPMSEIVQEITEAPNNIVFYVFVFALFLPEFGIIISSKFRLWLKNALENNDGVLDGGDLKETISYLGAYYCAKLFAFGMLCDIFYIIQVNEVYVYMSFAGFAGTTGVIQLTKIFKP